MEVSTVSDRTKTCHLMLSRLITRAQTNELGRARLHVPALISPAGRPMDRKGEHVQLSMRWADSATVPAKQYCCSHSSTEDANASGQRGTLN